MVPIWRTILGIGFLLVGDVNNTQGIVQMGGLFKFISGLVRGGAVVEDNHLINDGGVCVRCGLHRSFIEDQRKQGYSSGWFCTGGK